MTSKDLVSGLVTPVAIIASTLSYSALIFSGPLAAALPFGIGFGLVSAGIMAIVFAAGSGVPFAIAGPDSKLVAVLATLSAAMAADQVRRGHAAEAPVTVTIGLIAGTLIAGAALYLLGVLKAGQWIRYVPYPVIAGFMAASGWMLAAGAIRLATGTRVWLELPGELAHGRHALQLAVTLAFATAVLLTRRVNHPLAFPALLVGGTVAANLVLRATGCSLSAAREAGWFLDLSSGAASPLPWALKSLSKVDAGALLRAGGGYVALVTVTAMTLLMGLMAVEIETRLDVDLDRELRLNGLANMLTGMAGGMIGTLSLSRTLFNFRAGARGRASGMIAGAVCLLMLAFGASALELAPLPMLAAILLQLGGEMLVDWLVKGWRKMQYIEYAQMLLIFGVIVAWDFVAGVALGIAIACVAFAFNIGRLSLLKLGLSRAVYTGSVDRSSDHREQLRIHGNRIQIVWLHGFVFFGSANRLLSQIKEIVGAQGGSCQSLILDFRQVLGIDSSAVIALVKLRQLADRNHFTVVFSGIPAKVEQVLRVGGLIDDRNTSACRIFADSDTALEWCEDKLLNEVLTRDEAFKSADEWLTSELGSDHFARLGAYLTLMEYAPGDLVIEQGRTGDSLYMLSTGRVTVVLRTKEGADLRLRSMVGQTMVGEMGFYRSLPRGASVRADQRTFAYRLSLEAMVRMENHDPALAYAFHRLVIRTLAERLDYANREIAALRR